MLCLPNLNVLAKHWELQNKVTKFIGQDNEYGFTYCLEQEKWQISSNGHLLSLISVDQDKLTCCMLKS